MAGRTLSEIATSTRMRPELLLVVLEDEVRRGRVRRVGDRFSATPQFVEQYGRALGAFDITERRMQ